MSEETHRPDDETEEKEPLRLIATDSDEEDDETGIPEAINDLRAQRR